MIDALASADTTTWLSIFLKTLTYAATLVAAGSVMVVTALGELTASGRDALRRVAVVSALAAAILSVLRVPVRASFLMGGSLDGALDPTMLGIVIESPLGASVIARLVGLALILAIALPRHGARWVALLGAFVTCGSFALRGHALSDPRLLLGVLVTVHMAGLAFWIGAFAPLARAARHETHVRAGALAHEFGTRALWVVVVLMAAGAATIQLLGAATPDALATPYGQAFLIKLAIFAGVLGLAALNKIWLTPNLRSSIPGAAQRLRWSVTAEGALVLAILATTAALTTLTAPPSDQVTKTVQPPTTVQTVAHPSGEPKWRF